MPQPTPLRLWSALLGAVLLACGGAASAAWGAGGGPSAAELALMPLPLAAFGSPLPPLSLASDSGVVSNAEAASQANEGVAGAALARLGRLSGYTLDYGSALSGRQGILQAQTTVELYRSAQAARSGLAFWRKDDTDLAALQALGFSVSLVLTRPEGVGADSFGDVGDLQLKGRPAIYGADVEFQEGALVGQVSVSASRAGLAEPVALIAARQLRARIGRVLAGAITGARVSLPAATQHAPGVDLATLALRPADVANASVRQQGYTTGGGLDAESTYHRELALPGVVVDEEVDLYPDAASAATAFSILSGISSSSSYWKQEGKSYGVTAYAPHTVALRVGDQSVAVLGEARAADGTRGYLGFISIRTGRTTEFVTVATAGSITLSAPALEAIAAAAAARAEPPARAGLTA